MLAAHLWGDVSALEQRISLGIGAERRLRETGETLSESDVEDAATRWRYDQDLIAADDLATWLSARELGVEEWLAYFRRTGSSARVAATTASPPKRHRPSSEEIDAVLLAESMCSGTTGTIIERLAGCVAVSDRVAGEGEAPARPATKLRAALDRLPASTRKHGMYTLSAAACREHAERVVQMAATTARFVNAVGGGEAVEREIESHVLEWTMLRCKMLILSSEEAAREAALLVREDGLTIAKAASVAKAKASTIELVLEDVDGPLRDRLVGARRGDLLGPLEVGDGFMVAVVDKRVPPSTADPAVRERAKERVVQRTVQAEVDKRIRWHERF